MSFLNNVKIGIRLIIGFSLMSLLLLLIGGLGYRGLTQMDQNTQQIMEAAPLIASTNVMKLAVKTHQLVIMEILEGAESEDAAAFLEENERATQLFGAHANAMLNGAQLPSGQVFASEDAELRGLLQQSLTTHGADLLPRIEKITQLRDQLNKNEKAGISVFRKLNASFQLVEPEVSKAKDELQLAAARDMAMTSSYSAGYGQEMKWPQAVETLHESLLEGQNLIFELERSRYPEEQEEIISEFQITANKTNELISAFENNQNALGETLPTISYGGFAEKLAEWKTLYAEKYLPRAEEYFVILRDRAKLTIEVERADTQADEVADGITALLDQAEQKAIATLGQAAADSNATSVAATRSSLMVVLIGVVLAGLLAWLTIKSITRPLAEVIERLRDIAEGEGDLTLRLDESAKTELGTLAHWFNTFVSKVQRVVRDVHSVSQQLASASQQTSAITEKTSEDVAEQQRATEQVAHAMKEMVATVQEVARNTTDAAEATEAANGETQRGSTVVNNTINRINELAAEVTSAADVIQRLASDSEAVGGVLDVIKGIAEQTNLLALNAAIEAARAGEQGRGFAVVADEVRTLAGRTQKSTQEIEEMIARLQAGAQEAVNAMESGRDSAQKGVDEAAVAGQSLEAITAAVMSIRDVNTQVASAAEEQNAVAEEINRNVEHIAAIADRTTSGAIETSQASEHLAKLSGDLQQLVGGFKI